MKIPDEELGDTYGNQGSLLLVPVDLYLQF